MSNSSKNLPPISIPNSFYELIRLYAFQNKLSISAAVRQLLKESPSLVALAKEQNIDLETMAISSWGGSRIEKRGG